ncbi:surface anchored protein [Streptococcus pneumoniae]|nr:surface anchored protein [Streptococcus pneumoniae]
MRKSNREVNGEKVFRYSIRKYHFGAASVAVAALMFFANGAVKADTLPVSPATANTEKVNAGVTDLTEGVPLEKSLETEGNKEIVAPESVEKTSNKEDGAGSNAQGEKEIKVSDKTVIPANQTEEINKVETNGKEKEVVTNKDKLESLLKEIDQLNLKDYTEDTVKVLQEKVAKAKEVLVNATTQKEIDLAYNALVGYKNAGLKRVPKPKGELIPKPDTTNGKATVGIKAENTEPNGTNIAGHNHSLNGTTLPEGSGFRTETTNGLSIEVTGDTTFRPGDYLNYNSKYVLMKLKYDKNQYGEKPTFAITGTPNVGIQFESSNPYRDKKKFYNRDEGYVSGYLRGTIPNEMIGKYNMLIHMKYNANGVTTTLKFPIEVKPNAPTLKEPAGNDGNKYSSLAATTLVGNHSEVKFEVNGQESPWINASNGEAVYNREQGFRPGDRVRVKAKAYSDTISVGEHRDKLSPEESESDWSSETTLPNFPAPTLNKDGAKNEVNTAFTTKSTQIDNDNSLTNEEKTEVKGLAEAAKNNAITKINDAQTETDLNTAKADGISNIQNVALTGTTKKASATAELEEAARVKKEAIASDSTLTTEERATETNSVTEKLTAAKQSVSGASSNQDVTNALTAGKEAINGVTTANKAKASAIAAIEAAASAKKTEISNRFDLATEDKSRALQQVDQEAKNAKSAVDKGVTNKDVEQAKVAGIDAINNINPQPTPRPLPTPQPQPSTPTQPYQGATETPTSPSEPAPQPSQPTTPSQPASPAPSQSSAPTQAPRVAASPSVSSTSTQAPAQEQVDKSELGALTQELDQRLKALATVSDPKIDAAKAVLLDAQKALEDSALTEQGLRTAVESVKAALNSLKDVQANASDSKPAQDKSDVKKVAEDSKDSDKMSETYSVPTGVFVAGLLALLGVIIFWLIRRKKDSELKQLSIELTKVLEQQDVAKADKKVLAKAQKLLQETLDFVKEESGSAETEAKLVEQLKAIISKLK